MNDKVVLTPCSLYGEVVEPFAFVDQAALFFHYICDKPFSIIEDGLLFPLDILWIVI
jgi:hypothetical protein